jgi:hypothetical protein
MTDPTQQAPERASTPTRATSPGATTMQMIFMFAWPLVLATVMTVHLGNRMDRRMESVPEIVVADDLALIRMAIANGAPENNRTLFLAEVQRILDASGFANAVVVSESMVLGAPEGSRLQVAAPSAPVIQREERR